MGWKDWKIEIIFSIFFLLLINPFNSKDLTTFLAKIITWLTFVSIGIFGSWVAKKHVEKHKQKQEVSK